jgi:hypothetical protein
VFKRCFEYNNNSQLMILSIVGNCQSQAIDTRPELDPTQLA